MTECLHGLIRFFGEAPCIFPFHQATAFRDPWEQSVDLGGWRGQDAAALVPGVLYQDRRPREGSHSLAPGHPVQLGLGPPVVPFYRFFSGGKVPLLKQTTEKKGTLV